MVEAGAQELPEETILEAIKIGHAGDAADHRRSSKQHARWLASRSATIRAASVDDELEEADRQATSATSSRRRILQPRQGRRAKTRPASCAKRDRQASSPRRRREPTRSASCSDASRRTLVRTKILDKRQAPRRPRPRRRSGRSPARSACCRAPTARPVHPRPDPGAERRHAGHRLRTSRSIDAIGLDEPKRYIHHYNFPPFSVGEARPLRGASRRDIGHGALAERALVAVLPRREGLPVRHPRRLRDAVRRTARRSMASACGSTLALMDAGVPIQAPGRRRGDGPDHRGRPAKQVRHPDRHPGHRGRARRHGLQGRRAPRRASPRSRWTSRCAGITDEILRQGAGAGPRGPHVHPRQDDGGDHHAAARRAVAATRRASPRSRSTRTRSATSSAQAAR